MAKRKMTPSASIFLKFGIVVLIIAGITVAAISYSLIRKSGGVVNPNTDSTGWLHTKNGKIYDSFNRQVILHGLNYNRLIPADYVYVTPDVAGKPEVCRRYNPGPLIKPDPQLISKWGFNSVRLNINWSQIEPNPPDVAGKGNIIHHWNEKYLKTLSDTISDLKKYNIAVILSMGQYLWSPAFKYIESEDGSGCTGNGIPAWLYPNPEETTFQKARCDFFKGNTSFRGENAQDLFLDVWKMVVARYKDHPVVVGVDIINEPWIAPKYCGTGDLKLDSFYEKMGKGIHYINPRLLLLLEDSQDYGDGNFAIKNPPYLPNLVYSYHLYTGNWTKDGKERTDRFISRARKFNLPLYIGEFDGFGMASSRDASVNLIDSGELTRMLKYLKDNQIHWAFWGNSNYESLISRETGKPNEENLEVLKSGL